jgi:hypothetical protein
MGKPSYINPSDDPMVEQLKRIADALEVSNALTEEKNQLSRDVLAFQRELLEQERAHTVVHVKPDIKDLAKAVNAEQAREVRLYGGVRVK